ncbi:hypothetical protein TRIP_D300218 [uncultured Paludibacter sp.]|nr:hypothetical protein TRIP_D300218 [uncultured Paludibacter sp.]
MNLYKKTFLYVVKHIYVNYFYLSQQIIVRFWQWQLLSEIFSHSSCHFDIILHLALYL